MVRRSDAEIAQRFRERYGVSGTDAQIRFEQLVLGSDFGANGWTTREQADELARRLELRSNDRLLDLGTGRGWPGLYLGLRTGCEVVLTDQPVDGLRHARQRAGREGVSGRCATVAASAVALPFRPESFDVVVHTDVLCCLRPKLSVLRATRRLLRPGGRTAFTTIHLPADLSPRQRRRAREAGPSAVETRNRDYVTLLTSVGFVDVDHIDVTAAYLMAQRRWLQHASAMEDELAPTEPPGRFAERITEQLATRGALDDGLLRRALFLARRPRRPKVEP